MICFNLIYITSPHLNIFTFAIHLIYKWTYHCNIYISINLQIGCTILRSLKADMIISFKIRKISWDAHKLTWISTLTIIIIIKRIHHESHYDHIYKFIKRKYDRHRYIYISVSIIFRCMNEFLFSIISLCLCC